MHLSKPFLLNCYPNISCETCHASKSPSCSPNLSHYPNICFKEAMLTLKCADGVRGQRQKLAGRLQSKKRPHLPSQPSPRQDYRNSLIMFCSALRYLNFIITGISTTAGRAYYGWHRATLGFESLLSSVIDAWRDTTKFGNESYCIIRRGYRANSGRSSRCFLVAGFGVGR